MASIVLLIHLPWLAAGAAVVTLIKNHSEKTTPGDTALFLVVGGGGFFGLNNVGLAVLELG